MLLLSRTTSQKDSNGPRFGDDSNASFSYSCKMIRRADTIGVFQIESRVGPRAARTASRSAERIWISHTSFGFGDPRELRAGARRRYCGPPETPLSFDYSARWRVAHLSPRLPTLLVVKAEKKLHPFTRPGSVGSLLIALSFAIDSRLCLRWDF
jgi:hypothetical protein